MECAISSTSDKSDDCCGCHKKVNSNDNTVVCDNCESTYHWNCTDPKLTSLPIVGNSVMRNRIFEVDFIDCE